MRVGYVKDFSDRPEESFEIASDNKIRFEIKDTGIGIPEDKLATIFLPFEQVSNDLASKKGTGLGLNIALRAVELLDGTLNFTSEQGEGSSFIVELPVSNKGKE